MNFTTYILSALLLSTSLLQAQENKDILQDSSNVNNKLDQLLDYDADGIPDADDRCPYEYGTHLGCPEAYESTKDSDGDGIADDYDKCPLEKGTQEFEGCKENTALSILYDALNEKELRNVINSSLANGNSDEAETILLYALKRFPENAPYLLTLGKIYLTLAFEEISLEEKESYLKKAESNLIKAIEIDHTNSNAYYNLGVTYFNKATIYNDSIQKLNSDFSKEGINKFDELVALQKELVQKAKPNFEEALRLDEFNSDALNALNRTNTYLGEE